MNDTYHIAVDILRLIASGLVGGLIATLASHRLTISRERESGRASRIRDFVAFMQAWRVKVDRLHLSTYGTQRDRSAFMDALPEFRALAESVRRDFRRKHRQKHEILTAALLKCDTNRHDQMLKVMEELINNADST